MSDWDDFIFRRDYLLESKPGQDALGLAINLVDLIELLAIHGSTGIDGRESKRRSYIRTLEGRIRSAT